MATAVQGALRGRDGVDARPATLGLTVSLVLVATAFALPPLLGWDVAPRGDDLAAAPTHGYWDPKVGPGTLPALLLALLAVWRAETWARHWSWRRLLVASYLLAVAWLAALALVDGPDGLTRAMAHRSEYLVTARQIDDVGLMLQTYVDRIPYSHRENWPTHVAGHPPGALLMFVGLVAVGLGSELATASVIIAMAASVPAAVMVTLRTLGAERSARLVAPFLVFSPAAVFLAVSADAVFTAIGAWGLAALAGAAVARRGPRMVTLAVLAGLMLGWCVMSSYGLPLLGTLALAVLLSARSWWPLPIAAAAAVALVLGFASAGFAWWEAYPVLVDRYWDGIASDRPASYWIWGNIAALLVCAGPLVGAGLAHAVAHRRERAEESVGPVLLLVGAAVVAVLAADLSQMSKAEVERIWLPFVPWLTLSLAQLPAGWRRGGLVLQLATALLVQHLLYTTW
ncbi:hypothetical protein [Nocardioides sp.]|uniref:hypothetical protein n=1 Tax=Nocardioides sp. TaxID=35761 RepID=UPI002CDB4106|nr:hypothetical protein [Nocardioides sp.]HXH78437.1 hypothetical protein [Nocardioides sp.]